MELTQSRPLCMVILEDGSRLFAETTKEQIAIDAQKNGFLNIQGNMVSTVKGNIRTIRDATDVEYYEFFVLEKLPRPIMEKMHASIGKIYENNIKVSLVALLSTQKRLEDEESFTRGITPQEKENRRKQVIRMNQIMVEKGLQTPADSERVTNKILTGTI